MSRRGVPVRRVARSRAARLGLAVAAAGLAAGCAAAPPPPVQVTDPIAGLTVLDLDHPLTGGSGYFPPERWPSACELLDDATLRAVFPQASGVVRTPSAGDVPLPAALPAAGGDAAGGDAAGGDPGRQAPVAATSIAVPERTCEVRFSLPGAPGDPPSTGAALQVEVVAAGDPRSVEDAAPVGGTGDRVQLQAGGRCAVAASSSDCFKGPLRFRITMTPPLPPDPLSYVVGGAGGSSLGGRTVVLAPPAAADRQRLVADDVLPRLDDAVLARVP